jgi:hypothetical protein
VRLTLQFCGSPLRCFALGVNVDRKLLLNFFVVEGRLASSGVLPGVSTIAGQSRDAKKDHELDRLTFQLKRKV